MAQPGSAPALGAGGQRFKSARPDHKVFIFNSVVLLGTAKGGVFFATGFIGSFIDQL